LGPFDELFFTVFMVKYRCTFSAFFLQQAVSWVLNFSIPKSAKEACKIMIGPVMSPKAHGGEDIQGRISFVLTMQEPAD